MFGIGRQPPPYCRAESLSLEELANYALPHPRRVSQLEFYRELFHSAESLTATVRALEQSGRLRRRNDDTYRAWDAYAILDTVGRHARVTLSGPPPRTLTGLATFPLLYFLKKVDETWWGAVEGARVGLEYLWKSRYPDYVRDATKAGGWREETYEEIETRLKPLHASIMAEAKALAEGLPREDEYWKNSLGTLAWLTIELREGHFESLARFCSNQLSAAVDLAELRLGKNRREIRSLVGTSNNDMTAPAISAASFSVSWKAFDAAFDELEKALMDYNRAMPTALQLESADIEGFLRFLGDSGLEQWYTEFSTVTWHQQTFFDQSQDQRIAVVYGRVRVMCALLEDAMISMAEQIGNADFVAAIEGEEKLKGRLPRFLKGPRSPASTLLDSSRIDALSGSNRISIGLDAKQAGDRLRALGMKGRQDQGPSIAKTPEQVLAAFVIVRNFTSHRFPIARGGERAAWFDAWSEYLPSINESMGWAGLLLWAVTKNHKKWTSPER